MLNIFKWFFLGLYTVITIIPRYLIIGIICIINPKKGNILRYKGKPVIPIIIIVFGIIDLGKAVVASKDDEIKKSIKSLAMRAVAGVFIFFVPTLVGAIFKMVGSFNDLKAEYSVCSTCISSPGKCEAAAKAQCKGTLSEDGCTAK